MYASTAQGRHQGLHPGDFQIAIICALVVERDAVEATMVLDRRQFRKARGDRNQYTLGTICGKQAVLVCLENMGPLSALECARDMELTFQNIAFALIVGCAGGVPYVPDGMGWKESDIHLGDVIISTQVIQYDQGSCLENELKRRTDVEDVLRKAPRAVRNFVNLLKTGQSDLFEPIQSKTAVPLDLLSPYQNKLRTTAYSPPSKKTDLVYAQDYRHKHHDPSVCDVCAACTHWSHPVCEEALHTHCRDLGCTPAFNRGGRSGSDNTNAGMSLSAQLERPTKIHVGRIASGSAVMKSAHSRDRIVRQDGVIGFEMEGAGVSEVFGTIVIKGVVDYADSHKNKDWRLYPMARAALCAAAIIEAIQLEDPPHQQMRKWNENRISHARSLHRVSSFVCIPNYSRSIVYHAGLW
jgi:nucleoside phosphorylase